MKSLDLEFDTEQETLVEIVKHVKKSKGTPKVLCACNDVQEVKKEVQTV